MEFTECGNYITLDEAVAMAELGIYSEVNNGVCVKFIFEEK